MFIDRDSIKIKYNDNNYISMGKYLTSARYGYHKLWASDTGRNLAGSNSGTLIGIFPKLTLYFDSLSKSDIELLAPLFDSEIQTVRYYDPKKKKYITIDTYSGDWEIEYNYLNEHEPFSIAFISNKRRK